MSTHIEALLPGIRDAHELAYSCLRRGDIDRAKACLLQAREHEDRLLAALAQKTGM